MTTGSDPVPVSTGARRIADLDFSGLGATASSAASPSAWEDEVLYFLLVDRFSDGAEDGVRDLDGNAVPGSTPPFTEADRDGVDRGTWAQAGVTWVGGTLAGITSKLGYLKRLGVTALWVSPVLKQAVSPPGAATNYHGYATQDFLDVDPHFGSADDLRDLVRQAHGAGLRIILDVVLNHAGDVFSYDLSDRVRYPSTDPGDPPGTVLPYWDGRPYPVAGWRDGTGAPVPFTADAADAAWPDGAVFPADLHGEATWTRRGRIKNWDWSPEYREGDFQDLKDITHGAGGAGDYRVAAALEALARAYCWWLAFADLDGFRIDTVKHMDQGATRYFASVVHEFAQSIGKDRFLLVAEDTSGRGPAIDAMELTGVDAVLGLGECQQKLIEAATGTAAPAGYFDLFRRAEDIGKDSQTWLRNTVVTNYDDHDQIRRGTGKARLAASPDGRALSLGVIAMNVLTLGIPCLYYGGEQLLDGTADSGDGTDRFLREAMLGGEFGAHRSRDRHVFDEQAPLYRQVAALLAVRAAEPALRRGRQYLREISGNGADFGLPTRIGAGPIRTVIAWSRVLDRRELLCAINTDPGRASTAWVTVDAGLHPSRSALTLRHGSDPGQAGTVDVRVDGGRAAVRLTLPPASVAIYG